MRLLRFIFFYLIVFQGIAQSQQPQFMVVSVFGTVTYGTNTAPVERGTLLDATSELTMVTERSYVITIPIPTRDIETKARGQTQEIKPQEKPIEKISWLKQLFDDIFIAEKEGASMRGGEDVTFVIIERGKPLEEQTVQLVDTGMPDHLYYVLRLVGNDLEKEIRLEPDPHGDVVLDNYFTEGLSYAQLGLHDGQKGATTYYDDFLYFLKDKQEIGKELELLHEIYTKAGISKEKIRDKLSDYLGEVYLGSIELDTFETF